MADIHIPLLGHPDLDLILEYSCPDIPLILFEVGIPNLVCVHLGMTKRYIQSMGHCDLTFGLVSRIGIESGAYFLHFLRLEFQLCV